MNASPYRTAVEEPTSRSRTNPTFMERTNHNCIWQFVPLLLLFLAGVVQATSSPPNPGDPPQTLDYWSFTDTTNWTSDYGYAPVSFTNLTTSSLGNGTALVVDSTNAAWLQYNVTENDGTNNITLDYGTVMFWFAPKWSSTNQGGTGPGQWGRFIEVGAYTTNASYGWWSLFIDPAGTNISFSAQTNNGNGAVYLSAAVSWTNQYWHHVALTYSSTNSALYLDGNLVTNGLAVSYWPGSDVRANGFYIGSDNTGIDQTHGMIDDLSTYNYQVDAGTIAGAYLDGQIYYYMNPLNAVNLSSAPSSPTTTPVFAAITGSGYLQTVGTVTNCVTSSGVWFTN